MLVKALLERREQDGTEGSEADDLQLIRVKWVLEGLKPFFFLEAILMIEPPKRHSTPLRAAGSYPVKVSTLARTRAVALFRRYNRD